MKKIKNTLLAIMLAFASILPVSNTYAANATIFGLYAINNGSSMHVEGATSALAVAIEVLDENETTTVAGPETAPVSSENGRFTYDIAGTFDTQKIYTVRVADYDEGTWYKIKTKKTISEVTLDIKSPLVGDEIKKTQVDNGAGGTMDAPDKNPVVTTTDKNYDIKIHAWITADDLMTSNYFYGKFEKDTDYFTLVTLEANDGYVFATDLKVNLPNGTLANSSAYDKYGTIIVKGLRATEDTQPSEEAIPVNPNTGVAPKASETTDRAQTNISLGVAIIVATSLTYGVYLINKRKAEEK